MFCQFFVEYHLKVYVKYTFCLCHSLSLFLSTLLRVNLIFKIKLKKRISWSFASVAVTCWIHSLIDFSLVDCYLFTEYNKCWPHIVYDYMLLELNAISVFIHCHHGLQFVCFSVFCFCCCVLIWLFIEYCQQHEWFSWPIPNK